jgi:hypothetical protein
VANRELLSSFLKGLGEPQQQQNARYYWSNGNGRNVVKLLEALDFPRNVQPLWKIDGRRSLLIDYLSDRLEHELKDWDVCLATRHQQTDDNDKVSGFLPNKNVFPVERGSADLRDNVYRFSGNKNAVADQVTPTLGLSEDEIESARSLEVVPPENRYSKVRVKPLLVVFLVKPHQEAHSALKTAIPAIALCLPNTNIPVEEKTYHINKVLRDQLIKESEDNADDDEGRLIP